MKTFQELQDLATSYDAKNTLPDQYIAELLRTIAGHDARHVMSDSGAASFLATVQETGDEHMSTAAVEVQNILH